MEQPRGPPRDEDVRKTIREVLSDFPVRLGVLFGSHARGEAADHSDVDVAVEYDPDARSERYGLHLRLVAALSRALGTDDVDVVDLTSVRAEIGLSALRDGVVLVGESDRAEELAQSFERRATPSSRAERLQRFDDVLTSLEESA